MRWEGRKKEKKRRGVPWVEYDGANYNNTQSTPDWQKPLTSFFRWDPNAPPPKMKDDDKVEEMEENKAPKDKGIEKENSSKKKGETDEMVVEEDEENEIIGWE